MKRHFLLGLLGLQQVTVLLAFSYDFTCPPRSQWNQRAKGKCGNETYHCLFDVNNDTFKEVCQEISFPLDEGLKVVLSKHLDTEKCSEHLYMPFIIKTNESPDCAFLKSSCNEEGQITCRVRSEKEDAVCACNFLEGYAFLQTPKHINYCVPSEEDCSCFKKSKTLTQDYQPTPQDETCSLPQFYSRVIREKYNELCTEADMTHLQKREASGSEVSYSHRYKDILGGGILMLMLMLIIVMVVTFLGYIFLEYQHEENIANKENGIRENTENMKKEIHNHTEETNFEPELHTENKSSENESFLFHCKGASIKPILKGDILKGGLKNEPRILDMCFMGDQQTLFLVWIDADNKALVRYKVLQEDKYGECIHFRLKDVPNRLSKINETKVAVIYKKKIEILIFNVIKNKEEMKYTINKDCKPLLESGIQGFVFLNETEIILSDKKELYKCSSENGDTILIPERFGEKLRFDTARRLTRVPRNTISEECKEIIIIADENDKQMTSLRGDDASIISQQISHNRGLQNVRAIVATAKRVYAATSAGVSVYSHSNGNFDIDKEHTMLLEYNVHVEHTRSLCLEEINGNVYFALSGVIKQKDFILIVNFEKDESFC